MSYSYDANGNLTSGNGRTLTWTSYNAPNTVSNGTDGFTYTYNAEHERTKLVVTRTAGTYTSVYLHPDGKGALLYEKELKPGSVQEHKHYLTAYGREGQRGGSKHPIPHNLPFELSPHVEPANTRQL